MAGSKFKTLWIGVPDWVHGFAWGFACVIILAVGIAANLFEGSGVWSSWVESSGLRRPSYSERIYVDDLLRTRANAWSNMAYVVVGLYAIGLGWHDFRQRKLIVNGYLRKTPAMSFAFGIACCYLGFGSGLFHASLSRFGQQLDVAAMYSPLLMIIGINVGRWSPSLTISDRSRITTWPILVFLVVVTSWLLFFYKWSMSSTNVLSTLIVAVGLLAFIDQVRNRSQPDGRWLVGSTAALVLAVSFRQLDIAGRFTGPDNWVQGHAIWHVLTGLCIGCLYCYFRSDGISQQTTGPETET